MASSSGCAAPIPRAWRGQRGASRQSRLRAGGCISSVTCSPGASPGQAEVVALLAKAHGLLLVQIIGCAVLRRHLLTPALRGCGTGGIATTIAGIFCKRVQLLVERLPDRLDLPFAMNSMSITPPTALADAYATSSWPTPLELGNAGRGSPQVPHLLPGSEVPSSSNPPKMPFLGWAEPSNRLRVSLACRPSAAGRPARLRRNPMRKVVRR